MTPNDRLSLDEFATAQRKKLASERADSHPPGSDSNNQVLPGREPGADNSSRWEAKKALRQVKRQRVKGERFFVNVSLDGQLKRRLKFASFDREISMQAIIEAAIVKYLDDIGA